MSSDECPSPGFRFRAAVDSDKPLQVVGVVNAYAAGLMIRLLDFNDTWLAAEWGHPSDNLVGISQRPLY